MDKPDWMCRNDNCEGEREFWDDEYPSDQCGRCNDRDIERSQERAEWNYYH